MAFIYNRAGDDLILKVKSDLKSGQYISGLPLTIEVPKSFRIRVAVPSKRLGPSFSRPGSILLPHDRLLYQALADAEIVPRLRIVGFDGEGGLVVGECIFQLTEILKGMRQVVVSLRHVGPDRERLFVVLDRVIVTPETESATAKW